MKKLLLLLLIAPVFGNSQIPSGLELTDIISVNPYYDGQLTVPNGKVWYIRPFGNDNARGYKFFPQKNDYSSETQGILLGVNNNNEGNNNNDNNNNNSSSSSSSSSSKNS